jgi:hypothetical protein
MAILANVAYPQQSPSSSTSTMSNLKERVAEFYDNCLEVNASWRGFTNQLALLNTFDILEEDDFSFVVELFLESDEFEDEDVETLTTEVGAYLAAKRIPIDLIDSAQMSQTFEETGTMLRSLPSLPLNPEFPEKR